MYIAAATTQGIKVDLHFGHATAFHIYQKKPEGLFLKEIKKVDKLSEGDPNHPFNPTKFDTIAAALKGCETIYCEKIGEKPKNELEERGFTIIEYNGFLKDIL